MSSVCFQSSGSSTNFCPSLRRVVGAEAHHVFLDAEELEIFQIHFVHGIELLLELLRQCSRCARRSC